MASKLKSRWANDEEDEILEAQRRREKEEKRRAKADKQRKLEKTQNAQESRALATAAPANGVGSSNDLNGEAERPAKRQRLSAEPESRPQDTRPIRLVRFPAPEWGPCRHVDNFEKLNHIEEGSYGWVSRARETATGEVVALKKLKMENSNDGFPVTGLREIQTLMESRHDNIVKLREVVMGDKMDE